MLRIVTTCAPSVSNAWTILRIFLSAAPISEFLHLEHTPVSPFDGTDAGGAQTFLL